MRNAYKFAASAIIEWQLTGKGGFPSDDVNEALQSTKRALAQSGVLSRVVSSQAAPSAPGGHASGPGSYVPTQAAVVVPGLPGIPAPSPRTISLPPVEAPRKVRRKTPRSNALVPQAGKLSLPQLRCLLVYPRSVL